jgi:acylphosphatase
MPNSDAAVVDRAVKCTIGGRVQGVYYRAAASERARELDVCGWVRNLADGQVELVAGGRPEAVEQLIEWLWQGSPSSSVTSVTLEEWNGELDQSFRILS